MNNFVNSAVALSLFAAPSLAGDNGWAGLDKEIESLSATLAQEAPKGPRIGGFLVSSYRYSSDGLVTEEGADADGDGDFNDVDEDVDDDGVLDPGEDLDADGVLDAGDDVRTLGDKKSGIQLDQVRVLLEGDLLTDYSYRISFDLASGGDFGVAGIKDAYVKWAFAEGFAVKIGRFRQPILQSSFISDDRLLFLDRTAIGDTVGGRDVGASIEGRFEQFQFWLTAQNGSDSGGVADGTPGLGDEYLLTARARVTLLGSGAYNLVEGAYGADEATHLSLGAAVADDTNLDDGLHLAGEAQLIAGPFSLAAEVVDFDDSVATIHPFARAAVGNTTPWDVTGSFALGTQWEFAVRFEDADDQNDTVKWSGAATYFVDGHNLKWVAQYGSVQSDGETADVGADGLEYDELALGIVVSI